MFSVPFVLNSSFVEFNPMPTTNLAFATIEQIGTLYRKRKLSPVELTKFMLGRIGQLNPQLNAYITVTAELAISQAKKAEKELFAAKKSKAHRDRGPLHGIPISLKDNIYTRGIRTTAGSKILRDFVPKEDAPVVSRLYEAGAILLGKTNMHEFAYGVTTNNPHFGATRNPWDLSRIPGGSSGGSAAAVAAGLCYASIGTDTGGSVRIPASLCGVVGFKPMRGQISDDKIIPLSLSLDCTGPLARTTNDVAATFYAAASPGESFRPWTRKKSTTVVRKMRIGIPEEFFFDVLDPEVQSAFNSAIACLKKLGIEIKKTSIPSLNETEDAGNQIAWVEATHYHKESRFFPERSADYGEDVRTRLEMGTKILGTEYFQACGHRSQFIYELLGRMSGQNLTALVVPTTPIAAPQIDEEKTPIAGKEHPTRALLLRLNRPANLANVPAISVPCGFTKSGLPIGLQLIGWHAQHPNLLSIAHAYELASEWHSRHPQL